MQRNNISNFSPDCEILSNIETVSDRIIGKYMEISMRCHVGECEATRIGNTCIHCRQTIVKGFIANLKIHKLTGMSKQK